MYRLNPFWKPILLTLTFLLAALPILAAPIAEVTIGTASVTWQTHATYDRLVLAISGPGDVFLRQEFSASETPSFGLFDTHGKALPDGSYTWELQLVPALDSETRAALDEARATGNSALVAELRATGKLPAAEDTVQSGYLTIAGGQLVTGGAVEPKVATTEKAAPVIDSDLPPTKDQVILDDLIVDGSACVGFDCVNGESFGFDTIRLKENNLRIKFQDTSMGGSFPTNDWQLTANDSANGGANKFSIDDIDGGRTPFTVEARAPSHSLYVDDGGRLGLGTSIPVVDVHVVSGNTPTLRLEQNGSSGFAPQTWDVAGNETNFFVRDASNGSTLPFRIRPGASSDALFIDVDNNIGMGTSSPDGDLHIRDTGADNLDLDLEAGGQTWRWRINNVTGQMNFINDTSSTTVMRIDTAATANLLELGVQAAGAVEVNGDFFINNSEPHPDYVFEDDYQLESITEHAAYMWENKHLPAVGAAQANGDGTWTLDVNKQQIGMLEELEKAHIYIEQLHQRLERNDSTIEELIERLSKLESNR